jgi:hypothetical protein
VFVKAGTWDLLLTITTALVPFLQAGMFGGSADAKEIPAQKIPPSRQEGFSMDPALALTDLKKKNFGFDRSLFFDSSFIC